MNVLLLNATYEPLKVISVPRAVNLMLSGKVEAAPDGVIARSLRTASGLTFEVPSILRLKYYVNVPHRTLQPSRLNIFIRDGYCCIYCGKRVDKDEATLDHIIPESRGGKITWGNAACACPKCNRRKANRTPTEAGMKLLWEPKTPRTRYLIATSSLRPEWKVYIEV